MNRRMVTAALLAAPWLARANSEPLEAHLRAGACALLQPHAVRSSAWCRCQDTAELAFGRHEVWPALNSFFDGQGSEAVQTALGRLRAGRFDVWVTHQVNMSALTGQGMAMGEGLLVNAQGKMIARIPFV